MPECKNCGAFVTSGFTRVFENNEDDINGCRDCMPVQALYDGTASQDTS